MKDEVHTGEGGLGERDGKFATDRAERLQQDRLDPSTNIGAVAVARKVNERGPGPTMNVESREEPNPATLL